MKSPYIIYGLPRSRTFWLSRFLSYGDWHCGHDEMRHARSLEDVRTWLEQPCTGTVETAAAPFWRLLPGVRTVVVRRSVADVAASLMRIQPAMDRGVILHVMNRLNRKLDQITARVPDVLSVSFESLAHEEACARIFEYCLPYRHDFAWWAAMAHQNLQVDLVPMARHYLAFKPALEKLAGQARQQMLSAMARKPMRDLSGITFQQERFDDWYRDATPLFREHMLQTGQGVEDYSRKNLPLLRVIEELGFMQITTARSNGRMFGYLLAVLSPSLDAPDLLSAMHLPFFVSKDTPGLGMKLQRASIEGLRARGVDEVFFRAGTRGDGPRLGAIYKRLGAVDFGQLFKLDLVEA